MSPVAIAVYAMAPVAILELEKLLVRQYSSNSAYIFGILGVPRFADLFNLEKHWDILC
jgi:uncharacterized membrane protein